MLSQVLPYPLDSGVAIRTYNVLRILSRQYDVTALCFVRDSPSGSGGSARERAERLSEHGEIHPFPIPASGSRIRGLWDHLRSLITRRPWVWYLYDSSGYEALLRRLLDERRFDLVHIDSLDLVRYLDLVVDLPCICVHHNVESGLLRRRAAAERSILARAYVRFQAGLLEREERRWCPRMRLNVTVSEEDRRHLSKIAPEAEFSIVPNGVDVERYAPAGSGQDGLVFVGGTSWFPNRDALEFFHSEVLPILHSRGETPTIHWVGQASPSDQGRFAGSPGLALTGYVEDERPWIAKAAGFIVPLRVGGGTRLKILNAWAMGKAVISTSVGCEGLDARHGENILIADGPEAFADSIQRVLHDVELRRRLERGARESAVARYSWDSIGQGMLRSYERVRSGVAVDAL